MWKRFKPKWALLAATFVILTSVVYLQRALAARRIEWTRSSDAAVIQVEVMAKEDQLGHQGRIPDLRYSTTVASSLCSGPTCTSAGASWRVASPPSPSLNPLSGAEKIRRQALGLVARAQSSGRPYEPERLTLLAATLRTYEKGDAAPAWPADLPPLPKPAPDSHLGALSLAGEQARAAARLIPYRAAYHDGKMVYLVG